jgi:hypothetical protein
MKTREQILATEFSEPFVELMRNRMVAGFYRYGPRSENAGRIDELASLRKRLEKYEETGNTEYLVDAANIAMVEFMQPQHPKAHFRTAEHHEHSGLVGTPVTMDKEP